jgi:hypothetical protein
MKFRRKEIQKRKEEKKDENSQDGGTSQAQSSSGKLKQVDSFLDNTAENVSLVPKRAH